MSENPATISVKKEIDVLMKEYETLRAEMLQRMRQRMSFLGLFGVTIGYLVFHFEDLDFLGVLALLFATLFLFAIWMRLGRLVAQCSERVAEIERQVNAFAGEILLVWETKARSNPHNLVHLGPIKKQSVEPTGQEIAVDVAKPRR
jgi:hypothetical protein